MAQSGKTFRVFVSSTFSDLIAERNALQEQVFPELRDLCMRHGCRFQAIDLRWGVSEEAAVDQQTMTICVEELRRCQKITPRPNFIVLLGQRYGWLPIPPYIDADEFEKLRTHIADADEKELLGQWYKRDDNADPAKYVLQRRTGEFIEFKKWEPVERDLHTILLNAVREAGFPETELIKYERSATEQEILEGAFKAEKNYAFCYFRMIDGLPEDKTAGNFAEVDKDGNRDKVAEEHQEKLKHRLRKHFPKNQIYDYHAKWSGDGITTDHLNALCERVEADLRKAILEEIESTEHKTELEQEIESHRDFRDDRAQLFIGRKTIIKTISDYVIKGDNHPLVIYGPSGSGKSALMARCVQLVEKENPNAVLIHRFIGATAASTDIRSLLESLCNQIYQEFDFEQEKQRLLDEIGSGEGTEEKRREIEEAYSIPSDARELPKAFKNFLTKVPKDGKLLLFLDALDQLSPSNNAHTLNWLPNGLSANVRMVVSVLDREGAAGECLRKARAKLPQESLIELKSLTAGEGDKLLDTWLHEAGRMLQNEQRADVLGKFTELGLPLYLKLAFEEARLWHSYDGLPCGADDVPGLNADIEGVILDLLARLVQPANHGDVMVGKALGYIAAARNGLTEDELLDVLSGDEEVMADFRRRSPESPDIDHIPVVVWSRLYHDIEPYMTERAADGTSLMSFYHRQFGEVIAAKYTSGDEKAPLHKKLAEYFGAQPHQFDVEEEGKTPNLRKMSELPFQQTYGEQWDALEETLTDLVFIEAKCTAGMAYDLVTDYDRINVGRARPGPIIKTAWKHNGKLGIWCSHCLAWFQIEESQLDKVINCPGCDSKLKINPFTIEAEWHPCKPKREVPQKEGIQDAPVSSDVAEFADFIRSQVHILREYPELTFQQAANQPDKLVPALRAKQRLDSKAETRPWIRWVNKPQHRDACIAILAGHKKPISGLSYSPNGQHIASVSSDRLLKIWDVERGELIATLTGHSNEIIECCYSPDGNSICTGSYDKILSVLDLDRLAEIATFDEHPGPVGACSFSPDGQHIATTSGRKKGRLANSEENTLTIWDIENGTMVDKILTLHTSEIMDCSYSPDGRRIITGSKDGTLKVWDVGSGSELFVLTGHSHGVWSCSYSPDGSRIASGCGDNSLKVWDAEKGIEIYVLKGHKGPVLACSYSPDGSRIVSGANDNIIKVWDAESRTELASFTGHSAPITHCCYSPDGSRIVTGSYDSKLRIWDADTGKEIPPFKGHSWSVNDCSYSPSNRRVVSASHDHTLKVWDVESGEEVATLAGHPHLVWSCCYSPDGYRIISGLGDGKLELWDAESGVVLASTSGHSKAARPCLYSPDGCSIVSASSDATLKLWATERGLHAVASMKHGAWVNTCCYSPDGKRILSASNDKTLKIWNAKNGKCITTMTGHSWLVVACSYSPNGARIVSGSWDKKLKVWDAGSGEEVAELLGHKARVQSCCFSPDGRRITSGSDDTTLKVWDVQTGDELASLKGHSDGVHYCAYSPDGKYIISRGFGTIKIWDADSYDDIVTFPTEDPYFQLSLDTCGRTIAAGGGGGTFYILKRENLHIGPPILTAWRGLDSPMWQFWRQSDKSSIAFGCPFCRKWSEIPKSALGTELDCPKCGKRVKLNPFTIDADWRPIAKGWGDDSHAGK